MAETKKVKVAFVFYAWIAPKLPGGEVPPTEEVQLSMGSFHGGSTFKGEIELDVDNLEQLRDAVQKDFMPLFYISTEIESDTL